MYINRVNSTVNLIPPSPSLSLEGGGRREGGERVGGGREGRREGGGRDGGREGRTDGEREEARERATAGKGERFIGRWRMRRVR